MFMKFGCATRILLALFYAAWMHRHQVRKSDGCMPYIFHCVLTAWLVVKYTELDGVDRVKGAIAAILHDVVEDAGGKYWVLVALFGQEIARAVLAISTDRALKAKKVSKRELLDEKLPRLNAQPLWVRAVEVSSKLANLLERGSWSVEKVLEYATDAVYAYEKMELPQWKLEQRLREELEGAQHRYDLAQVA